jgi:DNA-binding SARP family transcriptional activator
MSYEFRVLGPIELLHERRPVVVGPAKRRAMLAALALDANHPVPLHQLVEAVWAEPPPASAVANLRTHAAALRRVLGDRLVARPRGYELRVTEGELDAAEFARLAAAGRGALAAGDPPAAVAALSAALALWRGDAGDGLPHGTGLGARLTALDEQRLDVLEEYTTARLTARPGPDVVTDLRRHLAAHPLRERAWGQLMLALYRAGNVAGALHAYTEARTALAEHLGIEPGPELVTLQRAMLDRDSTLDEGAPAPVAARPATPTPRQLPPDLNTFVGRTRELGVLAYALRRALAGTGPRIVTISGRGGVGKTALAVHAAHLLAGEFQDGQVAVDLRGGDPYLSPRPPAEMLGQVLRALGVPPAEVPVTADERAAHYRSLVAGRRMLVLVDDVATAAQVRPLMPGDSGGVLLATSRRPLATLDGAVRLEPGPLGPGDGARLLTAYAGAGRVADDPTSTAQLVRLCAGLPLALRIVGARLASRPSWPLAIFAAQLSDDPLDGLQFEDLSVRDRFAADYLAMAAENELAARLFRLMGLLPGGQVTPAEAAAQLDVPAELAFHALEELVDARLADSPRPGAYRVPDLLLIYAAELAADDDPRAVATALPRAAA